MSDILHLFPRPSSSGKNLPVTLLRYLIETAQLAGYQDQLSPELLYKLLESAPRSNKDVASDEWAASSFCWRCIEKIAERVDAGKLPLDILERIVDFWVKGFAAKDGNLRGTLLPQLQMLAEALTGKAVSQSGFDAGSF